MSAVSEPAKNADSVRHTHTVPMSQDREVSFIGSDRGDRLGETRDADDFEAFDGALPGCVGAGHDGALEAVLGGLAQALLAVVDRADLPRQAHLAEHDE